MTYNYKTLSNVDGLPFSYSYSNDRQPSFFPLHFHEQVELLYLLTGSLIISDAFYTKVLSPGDIILFNTNEIHSTSTKNSNTSAYILQISSSYLKTIANQTNDVFFSIPLLSSSDTMPDDIKNICQLQSTITRFFTHQSNSAYGFILLQSILCEIIFQLFENFQGNKESVPRLTTKDYERIYKINQYIKSHYNEHISLHTISRHMGLASNYFSKYFHKVFGITFSKYLSSFRLEKVYSDLISTDTSILYLSEKNGFVNYPIFCSKFKEAYGCTPSECRKKFSV